MVKKTSSLRILIIDDSPTDRRIYHRFLEGFGWDVSDAPTAEEGLKLSAISTVDCILLDYRMPGLSGLAILPLLKKACKAPIILITGEPDALILSEGYRLGASAFLNKDFISSDSLRESIEKAVAQISA